MKRMLICTLACHFTLSSIASAQGNVSKAIWPFGRDNQSTTNTGFNNINPFTSSTPPVKDEKLFGLPSPTKLIDKAQKTTDTMIQKTRDSWKGVLDFGKSLNPFSAKSEPKQKRKSMISMFLPKRKAKSPATVGEFLTMDRPSF